MRSRATLLRRCMRFSCSEAGWHAIRKLRVPKTLSLLLLPPKSPELNPIENLWQFLRQIKRSNRVFEGYDAVVESACDPRNSIVGDPALSPRSAPASGSPSLTIKGNWYKPKHQFLSALIFELIQSR